ncbi:MAG: hypothetical protein HY690_14905 [Chloroflexi bacterium]|nr:hypothetical protein [Chloroflexota bacterium]
MLSLSKDEPAVAAERLTLAADATLPFGLATTSFDDEGVPGQRVELVRDGVVAGLWATRRYADYLGLPATGQLGNLVVAPGSASTAELLAQAEPTLHVVAFSWFDPDPISGDFVAEVRLGYELDRGQTRPVKGGSVSGNVFTALANARFSRDLVFRGSYHGPETLWFANLTISGR